MDRIAINRATLTASTRQKDSALTVTMLKMGKTATEAAQENDAVRATAAAALVDPTSGGDSSMREMLQKTENDRPASYRRPKPGSTP